jgi:hypothetical protein
MSLIITDAGKVLSSSYVVGKNISPQPLTLRLYSNDYTPDVDDTASNYIEVSSTNGYSPRLLSGPSWSISSTGLASYPEQRWDFTGSLGAIYGLYITKPTSLIVSSVSRTANVATLVTSTPHGFVTGDTVTSNILTHGSFSSAASVSVTVVDSLTFTYSNTGADAATDIAYGFVNKTSDVGDVVFAERFSSGPYTVSNNGDFIRLTLNFSFT